jgi:hypothetical protein
MPGYGKMGMGSGEMPMRKKDVMGKLTDEIELPSINVPEGVELSGESGTAEINWRMNGDGKIEITALNGVSLGGEIEERGEETETEGEEYA